MAGEQIEFGFGGDLGYRHSRVAGPGSDNFFIGLQPDRAAEHDAREVARDLQRRLGVADKIRPLHVTIQGVGRYKAVPSTWLPELKEAVSAVRVKPFTLSFDEVLSFKRDDKKSPLVLCSSQNCASLFDLQQKIADAQQQPGIEPLRMPAFTPHMTLFYTRKTVARERLSVPVQWVVRRFCIIRSYRGDTEHHVLWP